jgi:hypothetical protein
MSLKTESFIAKTKDFVVKDLNNIDESLFVSAASIEKLNRKNIDSDYLEGVLLIEYNGIVLLGFKEYDLIDQLIMYFVDAIDKFKEMSEVEFSFPDQPFQVKIERKEVGFCILSLNDCKTTLKETEFVRSMLGEAEFFFSQLLFLLPEEQLFINQNIEYIARVKKKYSI